MEDLCIVCHKSFKKQTEKHKICSKNCRDFKKISESNNNWVEKKEKKKDLNLNSKIESSRLYKQNGHIFKKFNAVRG